MAEFSLVNPNDSTQFKAYYPAQDNTSSGYIPPYKLMSGIMRGVQGVGTGGLNFDSANNRITVGKYIEINGKDGTLIVTNPADGSKVGLGTIPDNSGKFGSFTLDADGNLVEKKVSGTTDMFDPKTGLNPYRSGKLPDGTYGVAGANSGFNVDDGNWT